MTTKEKLIEMCVSRGMFEKQAREVVELAIPKIDKLANGYKTTWDRPSTEYPDVLYGVMFFTVARTALDWIDKNLPEAWFRPMFVIPSEDKEATHDTQ